MKRKFAFFLICAALVFAGCDKLKMPKFGKKTASAEATPSPAPAPVAAGALPPAPPPPVLESPKAEVNSHAAVMVLCYHRFEAKARELVIVPEEFEKQMQALKDNGFTVIKMEDFLAWRRGEKSIAEKSCIITLDDGWRSGYEVAWPILKKHDYPFTMFIYTNYVKGQPKAGGQSLSWEELAELRDAGVDIECHTVSHSDLRLKKGKLPTYEEWLEHELGDSRKMLEERLGIAVKAIAYPYGNNNAEVRAAALKAGYEAAFTVYGQRVSQHSPADALGRYAIDSLHPAVFQSALKMIGGGAGPDDSGTSTVSQLAASSMVTQPMEGETISNPKPLLRANLAALGEIDPASVEMRVSGIGPVPVKYDPVSKNAEAQVTQKLRDKNYSVLISAKVKGGRKTEVRWNFNFDPSATPGSGEPAAPSPPPKAPAPAAKKPATAR